MKRLTEPEVYELFKKHSLPVPTYKLYKNDPPTDWSLFPCYLKVAWEKLLHKSDSGAVVRCETKEELLKAWEDLKKKFPQADFIVEQEVKGVEGFLGVLRDEQFGHVIAVGLGGIYVELIKDAVFIPVDADKKQISRQLKKTKLSKFFDGFRGKFVREEALLEFIRKLAEFIKKNPQIKELDLNPLFLNEDKVIPADARAVLEEPKGQHRKFSPISFEILNPSSIAVIGASKNPQKVGYALLKNLEEFEGKVFAVNPKYKEILGFKCFASVLDINDSVDCALIAVPARFVPDVVKQCAQKGVKLCVVISAGFGELGPEGKKKEEQIKQIAASSGMRILGVNTLGYILPRRRLNASFAKVMPSEGNLGFLSQSGALITTLIDEAEMENLGFSAVVSLGNQTDITFSEAARALVEDKETKVIFGYVEGLKFGRELLKEVSNSNKPFVLLKVGRAEAGKKAASSHTGSIAGNYKVFKDCLECCGAIVVDSIQDAFDVSEFLSVYKRVENVKALVITNAGGPGALLSDYLSDFGVKLSDISDFVEKLNQVLPVGWSRINPVDVLGDATSDRYAKTFEILQDADWDVAFVVVTPQAMTDVPQVAKEIIKFRNRSGRAVVACVLGGYSVELGRKLLKKAKVPTYDDVYRAAKVAKLISL